MPKVVSSLARIERNIREYVASLARDTRLADRLSYHRTWYAIREPGIGWLFGPSKFIGYPDVRPSEYLAAYNRKDGRETEPVLQAWFEPVDPTTALGKSCAPHSKTLRSSMEVPARPLAGFRSPRCSAASTDHRRCPRRAHRVRSRDSRWAATHSGTRVGVSQVLAALAAGDTAEQIVDELPSDP
jgi:hypothetical protein